MRQVKTDIHPLKLAAAIVGNQSELARLIGINKNHLSNVICGRGQLPAKYCRQIEALTNGDVTAEELRPDVFLLPSSKKLTA
jgi:DNA-binding transcriptional regulator YdaS (Cro superfamily)